MRARRGDPHTLVGAYAMDAVTDGERASFERHLAGCESCRAETRGLRETTARLATAAAVRPREEIRDQTVLAAGMMTQLPPVTPGGPGARPGAARRAPAAAGGRRARRPWLPRLAVGLAAAFAVAAVGLGAAMHGAEHRLDLAQQRGHAMAAVLGAPDATMLTAQVSRGGLATVVMSHRDRALVFTAAGLPALPAARAYQLWLMGPGGPRSAGVLPAARGGMAGPMVVSGLRPGEMVGLTVEPAGGAVRPSSPPIMMLALRT